MNLNHPSLEEVSEAFDGANLTEVGRGGFKRVYKAELEAGVEALKVIPIPDVSPDDKIDPDDFKAEFTKRIEREVRALERCSSPFIVELGSLSPETRTIGEAECLVYTEEFLDGEDLGALLKSGQKAEDEAEAKILTRRLVKAIRELWSHELIHRDIKPMNVVRLADKDRPFVVLDLGVAFALQETALTNIPGFTPGTPLYFPPEFFEPDFRDRLSFRSDIYCAGIVVHEFSAGFHPLAEDENEPGMITTSRLAKPTPYPLKDRRPDFSDEFCELVHSFLKRKPALRPGNFEEILSALDS